MQFFVPYQRQLSILENVERSLAVVKVASQSTACYTSMKLTRSVRSGGWASIRGILRTALGWR